jgi:superfamily I DNA and/or RNA helicase
MYRGKQILVAGDGQQLRPSELYQVRWTEEESDSPDVEVESLLELTERYLPTVNLQGHYRSKSLELIEFSNRHFYDRRLKLLPDRHVMNRDEPAIEYVKVDGVWEDQTNRAEAETVVQKVIALLKDYPGREIGIVTFNAPQQNLILDVLEDEFTKNEMQIPSSLFVKNIENVQGDEKDIIIFSVGYAPDKMGKMAMLFGSLSTLGGENRLNVAVTRAREKVIVVTSILPEQLSTQHAKNQGPKLLQEYLDYAKRVSDRKFNTSELETVGGYTTHLSARIREWGQRRLKEFSFAENILPHADISVLKDNRHLGVVLTDDDRFNQSISIKDAFAYTPSLLMRKNWGYRFVYSRQVWKDIEDLEQKLMIFIGHQDKDNGQKG